MLIAARCYASAAYAVMRCLSVCLSMCPSVCVSVTFVSCVKTNKDIFEIFSPLGSQATLVFPYQTGWRYSDGNPLTGASNAGWVGKNAILDEYLASLHAGLHCCQPYESRSVKNKAARNGGKRRAEHSRRRPSSVVRTRRRRSVCDGLDVIRRRRRSTPPDTTPLVITPVSAAVGHRRTGPGWYYCWKLTNPYSWPYPTHERQKTRGLWPSGVCPGGVGRTPSETTGDSRT